MRKLKENNRGITLIALVITIIVLLILAGVAIATLIGDNGILTQSQKAKYVNIYKGAEEQVQLATMAVKAEIAGQKAKLGTYNAIDTESINALKAIVATDLVSEGSGFEVADPVDGTATGTKEIKIRYSNTALKAGGISDGVPAQTGHVNYIITVTAGDATLEANIADENFEDFTAGTGNSGNGGNTSADPTATFGTVNTAYVADFGKIVTGYDGYTNYQSTDVWRLFYADSSRAYLIKNSIGNYALDNSSLFPDFSTVTGETISKLGKNLNLGCSAAFWTSNPNYSNKKGTAVLLNSENFKGYANGYAHWAVGAPTLEMFVESFNATHTAEAIAAYKANEGHEGENLYQYKVYCQVASDVAAGYEVRHNGNWSNSVIYMGSSSHIDCAIYGGSGDWWLASPSAVANCVMMKVGSDNGGSINTEALSDPYNHSPRGVRPLVSVPISKIGNGITITSNYR